MKMIGGLFRSDGNDDQNVRYWLTAYHKSSCESAKQDGSELSNSRYNARVIILLTARYKVVTRLLALMMNRLVSLASAW